jgi:hypothetical protein
MPAARISLDVAMPQILAPVWSLEIPLSAAADAKTWTQKSARLDKLPDVNSSVTARAEPSDVLQGSPLWNDLNAMDQKLMSQITTHELVVGTALTVSTGFTVGYVIWMLRGGMLLTSLLAQMPAWRLLDPLVILSQPNDFANGGEQETLQTIVDSSEEDPIEQAEEEELLA